MNNHPDHRKATFKPKDAPGLGDDIPCSKCGAVALDTGLECDKCGHDMAPELLATPAAPAQPRPKARQIISAFHQFRTGELNGFAAAVRHLWQVPPDDVRTPELAAEHLRKRLAAPASAGVEEFPLPESKVCEWHQDGDEGSSVFATGCGHFFQFNEGVPADNGAKFCLYCGGTLKQVLIEPDDDASLGLQARTEGKADRGIVDSRCNYIGPTNGICNKCGRQHDGVLAVVNFPGTDGSGT